MASTTTTLPPVLEETYYEGEALQLYSYPPPPPPTNIRCPYDNGSPHLTEITERYNNSVKERITLPSVPSDLSITLEERFNSSMYGISHVWLARVQHSSQGTYPSLLQVVAKIYDPVWFDDAEWFDPFKLRNLSVSQEVECYRRLEQLQGTKVPRCYGHFITALPSQQNRTVNVVLMQYIQGKDLRYLVHPEVADKVCAMHKNAVIEAIMHLVLDLDIYGVHHLDMQSRNVMLLSPKKRRKFCTSAGCPLRLEADCKDLGIVVIDFEHVEFREPKWIDRDRQEMIDRSKPTWLLDWFEGRLP